MFAFANVLHFFAHKFAGLSGWRPAFALIFARPFSCIFFWHYNDFASSYAFGCEENLNRNSTYTCLRRRIVILLRPDSNSTTRPHHRVLAKKVFLIHG
jgi:hypothetical protein